MAIYIITESKEYQVSARGKGLIETHLTASEFIRYVAEGTDCAFYFHHNTQKGDTEVKAFAEHRLEYNLDSNPVAIVSEANYEDTGKGFGVWLISPTRS